MSPLAVMVFNVALKPSGAISNPLLLISTALKSRGNLCGYSNEQPATVRSCSQRLRKQRFLSTWVMQSVLFLNCDSLWLNVGAFSLATETHHTFLALLQQTAICKLWWSDQNYYCAEYILLSFNPCLGAACLSPPPALTNILSIDLLHWSYLGLWGLTQLTHGARLSIVFRHRTTQNYLFMTRSKFASSSAPRYTHTWNRIRCEGEGCQMLDRYFIDKVRWTVHQQWAHCFFLPEQI